MPREYRRADGFAPSDTGDDPAPPDSYAYRRGAALLARLRATPRRFKQQRAALRAALGEMIRVQIREETAGEPA